MMAADVDKRTLENGSEIPPQTRNQNPGSRSWIYKGLWTLLFVGAVPLLAFGIKYYQDAQLLKRHVRSSSVLILHSKFIYVLNLLENTYGSSGCSIVLAC